MFGLSFRSLDSEHFGRFCAALRADSQVPSARTLGRRQTEMAVRLERHVEEALCSWGTVHLAVDGWTDTQHCEVCLLYANLCITYLVPPSGPVCDRNQWVGKPSSGGTFQETGV